MTHSEIEAVIGSFYAAFDNRGARPPEAIELRALFVTDARIIRVSRERVESWTVEEFITSRIAMLTDGTLRNFHEWELEGSTTLFDNIANRESHYGKTGLLNGAGYSGQGRKFIQLCRVAGRWLINSVLWEDL